MLHAFSPFPHASLYLPPRHPPPFETPNPPTHTDQRSLADCFLLFDTIHAITTSHEVVTRITREVTWVTGDTQGWSKCRVLVLTQSCS
jgi:hypothetical protein